MPVKAMGSGPGVGILMSCFRDDSRMRFVQIASVEIVRWLGGNERFTFDTMKEKQA